MRPRGRSRWLRRVTGISGQPSAGGALPGAAWHLGGQKRCRGRAHAGRHGPHRPPPAPAAAGDSDLAEAIKLLARAHQTLIWERHRHLLRLRAALVEFFPAALAAFPDLAAADALELLQAAPDPTSAARLSRTRIAAALTRASRRGVPAKAAQIQQALRAEQLPQPEIVVAAYAATVRAAVAVIGTLNAQIEALAGQVEAHFGEHRDAAIYRSQPGLGGVLGARVLGEFGDDPGRYRDARARKNYAGSPR